MSDAQGNQAQNTLDDVDVSTDNNGAEAADEPKTRGKRSLIDVPSRSNIGVDGNENEEFK